MLVPFIDAQRDPKTTRLRRELGMAGYGVFWSLLELSYDARQCEIDLNYSALSSLLNVDADTIRSVVVDYDLFEVDYLRGVFWSKEARSYREKTSEKRRNAARLRWSKKDDDEKRAPTGQERTDGDARQTTQENDDKRDDGDDKRVKTETTETGTTQTTQDDDEYVAEPISETIITIWNDLFKETSQEYRGLTLDAITYNHLSQTISVYTIDEIKRAFNVAKLDTSFGWRLKDALKPDNIQLLLIKGERDAKRGDASFGDGTGDSAGGWGVDFDQFTRRAG